MTFQVLDLFSGIGGFSLGLERTGGFETAAFCEVDKKAQLVLKKHWPDVPIYDDVQDLTAQGLSDDGINPTVICGGFPCQDISFAGKGEGIEGKRSGLWSEYARLIGEIRPRYAIVENVSALLTRGLDRVLADLAEIGFDAEWHCIPATYVGAPHRRDRIWIIAYGNTDSQSKPTSTVDEEKASRLQEYVADSKGFGVEGSRAIGKQVSQLQIGKEISRCHSSGSGASHWEVEPNVGRVAHGVPKRVDRLKQLGNAVVPQIPEMIGEAILQRERLLQTQGRKYDASSHK
jgi:DNA (cytosine-5)-methyltransferase 1